jgi:two-component system response regulator RegA
MKYLIVDDDSVFRERLIVSLQRRGADAIGAASSADGLRVAKESRPDRVVLDLRMPGSSGLELISWLQAYDPALPIVVLTGFGSIATTQTAIRAGAKSYLTKPCSLDRLLEAFSVNESPKESAIPVPSLDQVEWEHMQRVLEEFDGNVTHTAKALGMDRRSLQRKLGKVPNLK